MITHKENIGQKKYEVHHNFLDYCKLPINSKGFKSDNIIRKTDYKSE